MSTERPPFHSFAGNKREELLALCKKHKVKRLALFGSAAAGKFDPDRSDLDFVVEFLDPSIRTYIGLAEDLEALFGRKVDLVSDRAIRNPFFRKSVEQTRVLLYEAA